MPFKMQNLNHVISIAVGNQMQVITMRLFVILCGDKHQQQTKIKRETFYSLRYLSTSNVIGLFRFYSRQSTLIILSLTLLIVFLRVFKSLEILDK